MAKPWPPPPDIDSIQELIAAADVEGFIADGAPADEYETEADDIFAAIRHFSTAEITKDKLIPVIEQAWTKAFSLDAAGLQQRHSAIYELAQQISQFFGPDATPQVRGF